VAHYFPAQRGNFGVIGAASLLILPAFGKICLPIRGESISFCNQEDLANGVRSAKQAMA
jgi:hypothetical protein